MQLRIMKLVGRHDGGPHKLDLTDQAALLQELLDDYQNDDEPAGDDSMDEEDPAEDDAAEAAFMAGAPEPDVEAFMDALADASGPVCQVCNVVHMRHVTGVCSCLSVLVFLVRRVSLSLCLHINSLTTPMRTTSRRQGQSWKNRCLSRGRNRGRRR